MTAARIVELRLTAFKSFRGARLPLSPATILIGRNSSGKSNALDGLEVLARLAEGEDLADALDGRRREGGAVRGGSVGCAPHGLDHFELGCTVELPGERFTYDLQVQVKPLLKVVRETLAVSSPMPGGRWADGVLLFASFSDGSSGGGTNTELRMGEGYQSGPWRFRDTRLALTQLPSVINGGSRSEGLVAHAAAAVVNGLRGVFHLDPVPHLMREFTPGRDTELRRTGENLSAALADLRTRNAEAFSEVESLVRGMTDERVEGLGFVHSELGDVMLVLSERRGPDDAVELTPAREMSDGMLRFTAVATALLSGQRGLDLDAAVRDSGLGVVEEVRGGVQLVIEELENGLHPSQARRVLDLVRSTSERPDTSVLVTTHSPALLDAVETPMNQGVVVCYRDPRTGYSELTRLVDLPAYARALAQGTLGQAVVQERLLQMPGEEDFGDFERLLGL